MVGDAGAVTFIREYAGLGPVGTNRKAGSGWGPYRVQKQVVGQVYKWRCLCGVALLIRLVLESHYYLVGGCLLSFSLCSSAFHDLLRARPSSLLMLCECISISIASILRRSM